MSFTRSDPPRKADQEARKDLVCNVGSAMSGLPTLGAEFDNHKLGLNSED